MRSRNTESLIIELDGKVANYQQERYVVMKFIHDEKHIVFNYTVKGRRRKEIFDGIEVVVAIAT